MILTLDEVKEHLRILDDEEDDYLETLIQAAQEAASNYCRVDFDEDAPEDVKAACKMYVAHFFENRDIADNIVWRSFRNAFEWMLYPRRDPSKMF